MASLVNLLELCAAHGAVKETLGHNLEKPRSYTLFLVLQTIRKLAEKGLQRRHNSLHILHDGV